MDSYRGLHQGLKLPVTILNVATNICWNRFKVIGIIENQN